MIAVKKRSASASRPANEATKQSVRRAATLCQMSDDEDAKGQADNDVHGEDEFEEQRHHCRRQQSKVNEPPLVLMTV